MTQPPSPAMTLARFAELVDSYGASLARWPAPERIMAQRLLVDEPEASRLLIRAQELDGLLDSFELADPSPQLRARVLEIPIVAARSKRRIGWRLAWAMALTCLIGMASGAYTVDDNTSAADEEWTELAAVSFYADLDIAAEDAP